MLMLNHNYIFLVIFCATMLLLPGCQNSLTLADFSRDRETTESSGAEYVIDPRFRLFTNHRTRLMGVKNLKGDTLIPPKFYRIGNFNQWGVGDAVLSEKNPSQWVKIDTLGNVLVQTYFFDNGPDYFYQGLARFVSETGKIGFINHQAQIVIPAEYDHAGGFWFHEPVALVAKGGQDVCFDPPGCGCHHDHKIIGAKWGLIDVSGKVVIPLEFDDYQLKDLDKKRNYCLIFLKDGQSFKVFKNQDGDYFTLLRG